MANSKISALTSATTPLAGTETLPVVQSSTTKQVSVANLTAGRTVNALTVSIGSDVPAIVNGLQSSSANIQYAYLVNTATTPDGTVLAAVIGGTRIAGAYKNCAGIEFVSVGSPNTQQPAKIVFKTLSNNGSGASYLERMSIGSTGDTTLATGNLIPGTAAKGINFTANTPAAGMTSQLLNWYEEGTWTPNQGAGLTLGGAFSSTGRYTRIGRQVSISGTVTGATSVAVTAAGVITSNLPFTVVTAGHGDATNVAITASATVICTGTSVTAAAAIVATGTITFSATYFV